MCLPIKSSAQSFALFNDLPTEPTPAQSCSIQDSPKSLTNSAPPWTQAKKLKDQSLSNIHQTTRVITADQENASMAQSMAAVFPSAASQEMADNLVIRKIPSAMRQTLIMFMQAPSTLRQAKGLYIYIYIFAKYLSLFIPFRPFSSLFSFRAHCFGLLDWLLQPGLCVQNNRRFALVTHHHGILPPF